MSEGTSTTSTASNQQQQIPLNQVSTRDDVRAWVISKGFDQEVADSIFNQGLTGKHMMKMNRDKFIKAPYNFKDAIAQDLEDLIQPIPLPPSNSPIKSIDKTKVVSFLYEFVNRDNCLRDIASVAHNNYKNRGKAQSQLHSFALIVGGSGIGKTRAGLESSNIPDTILQSLPNVDQEFIHAMRDPLYFHINLGNGMGFRAGLDSLDSSIRIGARIAHASGIFSDTVDGKPIFDSLFSFISSHSIGAFDLKSVLNRIIEKKGTQPPIAIIIHLDEFQLYIDQYSAETHTTKENSRLIFKSMLKDIGDYMTTNTNSFILPLISGTSERDVSILKTEFEKVIIKGLNPLNRADCQDIIKYHCIMNNKIKENLAAQRDSFEICLADTGFIPKDISFLLQSCEFPQFGQACFTKIAHLNATNEIPQDALSDLCLFTITQLPVTPNTPIGSDGLTIENFRRKGIIYLKTHQHEQGSYQIYSSFINIKSFMVNIQDILIPDNLLFFPTGDNTWQWQEFEKLYPYYQLCLIKGYTKLSTLTFQKMFRGAHGVDRLPTDVITSFP